MADTNLLGAAVNEDTPEQPSGRDPFVLLPSSSNLPIVKSSTPLTPLVCDERAIARLLATLLSRGGLSPGDAARQLGVTPNAVRQYIRGRRNKPSLIWFIRFAELCGARILVEFPSK
jgi:hypothetical protein